MKNWFGKTVGVSSSPTPIVSYNYSMAASTGKTTVATTSEKSAPVYSIGMLGDLTGQKYISEHKALGVEAFFSCIQDQAGAIGSLPLKMYRMGVADKQPERVRSGQVFKALTERPNPYQTMQDFIEMLVLNYRTNGAFYAMPMKDDKGRIIELIPFANQMAVQAKMDLNGQVYYSYTTNDGKSTIVAWPEDLFIVKGMTVNGYTPVRPLTAQAQLMGIAINQEEGYATLQEEGITSQMALGTENLFDNNEARQRLREDFAQYRGAKGRKSIPILEQGLKPIPLNLTPAEMDLLNQRQFTVQRICAVTETMPHRIGAETIRRSDKIYELDEAQFKKWNPLLVKIEHELTRVAGRYLSLKFDRNAFYAGSPVRLAESVERQFRNSLASLAEARESLGHEFVPGTENIWCIDSNNITLGNLEDIMKMRMNNDDQSEPV